MRKTLVAIGPLALVVLVACADDEVEKDLTPATTVDCPAMDAGARSTTPPGMTPTTSPGTTPITPPAADASSPTSSVQETTYVLVHGGGHGGWCYQRVARLLRKAGHNVYTPTMTGVGERAHLLTPDVNLDTQITDVVKLLEYEDLTDVVLVGHSFGGMVISGIGDRATSRIGKIVFLDAIRPENGQALYPANAPGGVQVVNGVEVALLPSEALVTQLGVTDPADAKWVLSKLTPHPWKALSQPLQLMNEAGLRAIPEYEINAAPHPPNPNAKRVWHVDTGHDMMITHPDSRRPARLCRRQRRQRRLQRCDLQRRRVPRRARPGLRFLGRRQRRPQRRQRDCTRRTLQSSGRGARRPAQHRDCQR